MIEVGEEKYIKITWGALAFLVFSLVGIIGWQFASETRVQAADFKASDAISRQDRMRDSFRDMAKDIKDIKSDMGEVKGEMKGIFEELRRKTN